jgi:ABC-type uncharacterized transport system substrate-binding protein
VFGVAGGLAGVKGIETRAGLRSFSRMLGIIRRLGLGILLIAATSALLLFSDLRSRVKPVPAEASSARTSPSTPAPARLPRVAIVQHNTQAVFDAGVQGLLDGLTASGFRDGENVVLRKFNPLGDSNLANAIAVEVAQGGYDLILTATTPSLQTVANANRSRRTPHLFALVADPSATGVGVSASDPLDHPTHLAGYGTRLPVTAAFRIAREINPELKTVGTLWNTSEINSEVQLRDARAICKELGITLVEVNVDSTNAVAEATAVLLSREIEAVFIPGDVTVLGAINNVLQTAQRARIPVFSLFPSAQPKGELFNVGADYRAVGYKTGQLAAEVLRGRSIASIAVENYVPERLALNEQVRAQLRDADRWRFPAALRSRAGLYVDADGKVDIRDQPAPASSSSASAAKAGAETNATLPTTTPRAPADGPVRHIAVAYFAPEPSWEDCFNGLVDELRTLGFEQGKNLSIRSAHTQGDASHILPILHNYDSSEAEVLVTFSTPMLQGALATIRHKPIVFTYVTDPLAAGAGKSWTDHDPRVTGVGTMVPVAECIRVLRALFPNLKRLGTLYNAGEVNSTRVIDLLRPACHDAGIELVAISIAATSEAPQAAQALASRQVEALYLPNDNLVYQAFPAVMQAANRARLPVFNGDPAYLGKGIFASVGPGYRAAGQAAAHKLARVLAGEKPAVIPMENVSVNRVGFDRDVARKLGLTLDEALLRSLETPAPSETQVSGLKPQVSPPPPSVSAPPLRTLTKPAAALPARIDVILYNESPPAEETVAGFKEGIARGPLLPGRDLVIKYHNAQGDMATLSGILDAALTERPALLVPLSTPSLQVTLAKTRRGTPNVVFGMVANPIAAGAGRTYEDHLAHVTGISVRAPAPKVVEMLKRHYPQFKRVGTLFCPAEVNSVDLKNYFTSVAAAEGITVEAVAVNSPTEIADAALMLASSNIDAIVQVSDNISSSGFSALTRAARSSRKPLLSMNSLMAGQGAGIAIGLDYHDVGVATADRVQRVLAGEDPATIPFEQPPRVHFTVHISNARATNLPLPEALIKEAGKVITE